jgi:chemotaxis response regulator CheB
MGLRIDEIVVSDADEAAQLHATFPADITAYDVIMVDMLASLTPNDLKDLNKVKQAATEIVRKTIVKRAQLRPLIVPSVIEV